MKFIDTDICSYQAFDNGVVLKVKQDSVLDAVDVDNKVGIYIYLNEISTLFNAVHEDSPDEPAPEALQDGYYSFTTNSAVLTQSLVVLDADVVEKCPLAKRNRAYVFVSLKVLHNIKEKLEGEIKRREQIKAFDWAYTAMTGEKLTVAKDSNRVVSVPA